MKCADVHELLSAYANNEISDTQKDVIQEHLAGCSDCRILLSDYLTVRQQFASLQTTPDTPDLKNIIMSKIKGTSNAMPVFRTLRPALKAIPLVIVLVALMLLQPWAPFFGSQSEISRVYAATAGVESYRFGIIRTSTSGEKTTGSSLEAEYSSPDRYYFIVKGEVHDEEFIIIGDKQYARGSDRPRQMIEAMASNYSSFIDKEKTLKTLEMLTDLREMPDENIEGVNCLHYIGKLDVEKIIAEMEHSLRESYARAGFPPPSEETLNEQREKIRAVKYEVELWIGENDHLLRRGKTYLQQLDGKGILNTSTMTVKLYDFNKPITIEPPLDNRGSLLPDWQLAGSITPSSKQPVFGRLGITSSIGAQEGYNDLVHQQVKFQVRIVNNSVETVENVRVILSTMATHEAQKPLIIEVSPDTHGHTVFRPDERETYNIAWNFDGTDVAKEETVRLLVDQTTIVVEFTTQDGRLLTETLLSPR